MRKKSRPKTHSSGTGLSASGSMTIKGNVVTGTAGNVDYKNVETHISDVGAGAQVVAGENIQAALTGPERDVAEIQRLIADLRTQLVSLNLPADKKIIGDEFVNQLEGELTKKDGNPDPSTIKTSGNWLMKNIPALAGALTSLFINPIVGKVVEAAGSIAADWVKEQFGKTKVHGQQQA